ncbi:hypothetical protein RI367_004522 [Sorochytrium milnesiophthora]
MTEIAVLGAGCFGGVKQAFDQHFGPRGLVKSEAGFAGGHENSSDSSPAYQEVCAGTTGHAEVVRIEFDAMRVTFRELVVFLFRIYDATAVAPAAQYRSIVLYTSEEQRQVATDVKRQHPGALTEIAALQKFYIASPFHQVFVDKSRNPLVN